MAKDPSKDAAARAKKRVDAAGYLTEIADESVTLAKLAHIQTNSFLGRHSAGTGDVERLSPGNARSILNVENGATNTNDPLADANQTMTASRTIDDGDNGYSFFVDLNAGGGDTCQFLLNPATPSATWKAQASGTDSVTLLNTGVRLNLLFAGSGDLALDSDPGADGECITSTGSGSAPIFDGFSVHVGTSAPTNTSRLWLDTNMSPPEVCTYDSTRGHWFGPPVLVSFGKTVSTGAGVGHYLYVGHQGTTATTQERGWLAPWGGSVTGWAFHSKTTLSGWTIRVDKNNGSGTNTTGIVTRAVSTDRFNDMTVDADFDSGDILGVALVSGTNSIENSTLTVRLQRRAS